MKPWTFYSLFLHLSLFIIYLFYYGNSSSSTTEKIKVYNLDEECTVGNKEFLFLAQKDSRECCVVISDGTHGIYLSLSLGTANLKHLMRLFMKFKLISIIIHIYIVCFFGKKYSKNYLL